LGYASAHTKASLKQILALLPRIDNKGLAVLLARVGLERKRCRALERCYFELARERSGERDVFEQV
jgi:hypothetical protein